MGLMKGILLILFSINVATAGTLLVCNSKPEKLRLALGFKNKQINLSKGWFKVDGGRCKEIRLPKVVANSLENITLYAHLRRGDLEGTIFREFCATRIFNFEREECGAQRREMFSRIGEFVPGQENRIDL